jgi:hypothetical protein
MIVGRHKIIGKCGSLLQIGRPWHFKVDWFLSRSQIYHLEETPMILRNTGARGGCYLFLRFPKYPATETITIRLIAKYIMVSQPLTFFFFSSSFDHADDNISILFLLYLKEINKSNTPANINTIRVVRINIFS